MSKKREGKSSRKTFKKVLIKRRGEENTKLEKI